MNLFDRLKAGLSRTRSGLVANLESVFASARQLDAAFYEELEDTLIMADVGVATSTALISRLQRSVKEKHLTQPVEVKELLEAEIEALFLTAGAEPFDFQTTQQVYLVVGVNGVGKTTTIAKLAAKFKEPAPSGIIGGRGYISGGGHRAVNALGRTTGDPGHPSPGRG